MLLPARACSSCCKCCGRFCSPCMCHAGKLEQRMHEAALEITLVPCCTCLQAQPAVTSRPRHAASLLHPCQRLACHRADQAAHAPARKPRHLVKMPGALLQPSPMARPHRSAGHLGRVSRQPAASARLLCGCKCPAWTCLRHRSRTAAAAWSARACQRALSSLLRKDRCVSSVMAKLEVLAWGAMWVD